MKTVTKLLALLVVSILIATAVSAKSAPIETRLYSTADGDGYAGRSWYGWNGSWADTTGQSVSFWHNGENRESGRGLVIIDISSLAGQTFTPNSISYNFYSQGITGSSLQFYGGDPGTTVTAGFSQAGGEIIADLSSVGEGWQKYDVTSWVSSAVQNQWGQVGFIFYASNMNSGNIAAFEDLDGRGSYLGVVPEPSGIISLLSGIVGMGGLLFRRRR